MIYLRMAKDRGQASFGWLESRHSFSFGGYHDPDHMGVSKLRVINDDVVAPGAGFGMHGHRDMEIISYVLEGTIRHKDNMGNEFVVTAGEVQRMSAGNGVMHSEFNDSPSQPLKFLQIWIEPNVQGGPAGYEQKRVPQRGVLTPLVTPDGRDGSLSMQQDASLSRLVLAGDESFTLDPGERIGYLHIVSGSADIAGQRYQKGDAMSVDAQSLEVVALGDDLEALWFDLPVE